MDFVSIKLDMPCVHRSASITVQMLAISFIINSNRRFPVFLKRGLQNGNCHTRDTV